MSGEALDLTHPRLGAQRARPRPSPAETAALRHLRRVDPVLRGIIDARPDFDPRAWLSELPAMDAFGVLLFQIVGQQLSLAATRAILTRIASLTGGSLPTPEQLLTLEPASLRRAGLSWRKAQTMRAIAERFRDGRLSEQMLAQLSDAEIEAELTEIPGVGPWTVHGFLIVALRRPDVMLAGDVALRRAIANAYALDHTPDEAEMLRIAEPWRPYRSLAVSYLFASALGG